MFYFILDNNKLTSGNSKQRASNIAQKAAQEAKAASDAQAVYENDLIGSNVKCCLFSIITVLDSKLHIKLNRN